MPVKVHIRDFQSLEDVSLEIENLTVVTGSNNLGKSSIVRAIRGAFQNTKGTAFIRHGRPKTVVDIDFGDGHSLTWEKGRGRGDKPTYIIDGGAPLYPGAGVPDALSALGVYPISLGGRDVWPQVAPQFTGQVFLLDQPGSVMAEAVADVARVQQLNEALRLASSDKRAAAAELQVRRNDESRLQQELEHFHGLDDTREQMAQIQDLFQLAQRIEKALTELLRIRDRRRETQERIQFLSGVADIPLPDMENIQGIQSDVQDYQRLRDRLRIVRGQIISFSGIAAIPDDILTEEAERISSALATARELQGRVGPAKRMVTALESELATKETELSCLEEDVQKILGTLEQCPVCGATLQPSEGH